MAEKGTRSKLSAPTRPYITLPPKPAMDGLFSSGSGLSPGPMTLVSSFFPDLDSADRPFSQLLASAMASPGARLAYNSMDCSFMDSSFGISHHQALAQVTAQASLAKSQVCPQTEYQTLSVSAPPESLIRHPSFTPEEASQLMPHSASEPQSSLVEYSEALQSDRKNQLSIVVDKPAEDGYNWRAHNHDMPQPNNQAKGGSDGNANSNKLSETMPSHSILGENGESTQAAELLGLSDSEEGRDEESREERDDNEPNSRRQNTAEEALVVLSNKTVTELKIILQTRSEVDLLDDGYRWCKYGPKVVKGPRSYYKCTSAGFSVRKHVERASTDPKAVITSYAGKHNHDVPEARNRSHNTVRSSLLLSKPQKVVAENENHSLLKAGFRKQWPGTSSFKAEGGANKSVVKQPDQITGYGKRVSKGQKGQWQGLFAAATGAELCIV
ncbi:ATP binding protein, putative isoform 1 [Hibiscus syriacus]|uniref:ATP binding protein, putative isoform 1 n=1 Tax=Hibiscus syriacus TaxID=106335 RepID=A0A6A2ZV20_HIBSY|nr:ATP binding protein, putative isoform 1 [Hibiscus syriacus]